MASQEEKDPCSTYDLDDWQWEFLRRNPRYIKAYKAVEWLKKRLDRKRDLRGSGFFRAFGLLYHFSWTGMVSDSGYYEGWMYHGSSHRTKGNGVYNNDAASGSFLNLPSPSASSADYKKFIGKRPAVSEIYKVTFGEDQWTPALLKDHEIAVEID